jgi:tRNA-modifying protein YgfZ
MATRTALLEDRSVLRVAGEDAATFLQGLLTNDVEGLADGEARYAALLSPQGKILFDFLVMRVAAESGATFLIDCPAAQAGELARRLGFYRLRAKVTISDESSDHAVIAFWDEGGSVPDIAAVMAGLVPAIHAAPSRQTSEVGVGGSAWVAGTSPAMTDGATEALYYVDPRDPRLGSRAILPRPKAVVPANSRADEYEAHRIELGIPKGGVDFAYADIFPHDANLDLLHGVDFEKGCYVGQEVVSRMRHRGGARKRIVRLTLAGPAPERGAPVLAGETTVGVLGSATGTCALAMVRLDRIDEAREAGRSLTVGGVGVALQR